MEITSVASQQLFEAMFDHKPKVDTRTPAETDPRSRDYLPIYFKEAA